MNILVVPTVGADLDPSIVAGQSLARWSGGEWRILHALGWRASDLVRAQARVEQARRMVQRVALPELPPASQRIALRSLAPALRHELDEADADLLVTSARRASDERRGWSLGEMVEVSGRPVLTVRDAIVAPPRRISVITEPQDLEHNVLQSALAWLLDLLGPAPENQAALPVEVDLVHVARAGFGWSVARSVLAEQLEAVLGQPHVLFRGTRPEIPRHIPDALERMRPDLVVVFQDLRGSARQPRLGKLARRIVDRSAYPVLLLPPGPLRDGSSGRKAAGKPVGKVATRVDQEGFESEARVS